ncbi:MAG: hypothetical protein JWO38_6066, partial [Gemmataceae bacterium]|nr:hypothetical protein [Gemmataceae bacterium]
SLPHRFGVADLTPRATDELLTAGPFDHADGMDRTHAALARLQAAKQAARQAWTEPTTGVSGGAQTARDVPAHPPDALARLQAARLSMAKPTTGSGGTTQTGRASTDGCQTAGPATSAGALFHTVAEYAKAHSCSLSSENVSRVEAHLEAECRRKGVTTAHYPDPVRGRIPLFPVSVLRPLFENYRLFA